MNGTDFELELKLAGAEIARSETQDACQLECKFKISSIHRNCQFGIIRGTDFELELQLLAKKLKILISLRRGAYFSIK